MHDDELTRARRALHGVDPEIDLARVYAESRARARGPATGDSQEGWAEAEGVEILLNEAGSEARRVPSVPRRRPVLAWGLAAAAAAVLAVSLAGPPVLRALPGSATGSEHVSLRRIAVPDHRADAVRRGRPRGSGDGGPDLRRADPLYPG